MAAITKVRPGSGAAQTIQQLKVCDSGGVERDIQSVYVRDASNTSRLVFLKPGGTGGSSGGTGGGSTGQQLAVTPAPGTTTNCFASKISTGAAVSITSPVASVAVTGGTAPYTYSWVQDHGIVPPVTINTPSASSTTFTGNPLTPPQASGGYFRCDITDASGLKVSSGLFAVNLSAVLQS